MYRFSGLPDGLKAESDGSVSGVPTQMGSFEVRLVYAAGEETGEKVFLLKVLEDVASGRKNQSVKVAQVAKGLVIGYPENLGFRVGEKIQLKL